MNHNFKTIFKYSIKNKVDSKTFFGLSLLLGVLVIAGILLFTYVNGNPEMTRIGIISTDDSTYEVFTNNITNAYSEVEYEKTMSYDDFEEKFDYVVDIDNYEIYYYDDIKRNDDAIITSALNQLNIISLTSDLDIGMNEIGRILTPANIEYNIISESENLMDDPGAYIIGYVFTIVGMLLLVVGTQFLGQEILDEKTTKAIEIIMTSASARQHMFAKICSNLCFMLILILEFILFGLLGFVIAKIVFPSNIEDVVTFAKEFLPAELNENMLVFVIITMILLVITLIILYILTAIAAGVVTTVEEYQSTYGIITLLIMVCYFLSLFVTDVDIRIIISYIPVANFYILPSLIIIGAVSSMQIIISISISVIVLIVFTIFGSKVYRVGLLNRSAKGLMKVVKQALKK